MARREDEVVCSRHEFRAAIVLKFQKSVLAALTGIEARTTSQECFQGLVLCATAAAGVRMCLT